MKIGIIINTNDPETVWNAFRLGVTSLLMEHTVKVFLLGKSVESENIQDKKFNVQERSDFCMRKLLENKTDEGERGLPYLYYA